MKTVVITGTSRGIGLATARKFLAEGWRVIGTHVDAPGPVQDRNFTSLQYDQGNPESVAHAAAGIAKLAPSLDALVNNAGVLLDADIEGGDALRIRRTLEIDAVGVVDLTERLLPLMHADSRIVNISSGYGSVSAPELDDATAVGYRMSKAALNMYTRQLAFRLEPRELIEVIF